MVIYIYTYIYINILLLLYMDILDNYNDNFFSCSSSSEEYLSADSDISISLNDKLSSIFSKFPDLFNVVHINAQSVPAHYSDLLTSFACDHLDAILISESFLKPSLLSTQFSLPGFKLIRNDRTGKGGGGVAIYLRADLSYSVITASPSEYSGSAEHLFIEVTLHHSKLLLGVYYSPSLHVDYFSSFETLLESFCPAYDHTIIMGDFNTCLLKNDSRSSKLSSLLTSVNLSILPLSATHHSPNATPSLLDLMIVSNTNSVATHGQTTSCFSYHDLIFLSYKIRPPKRKPKFLLLRNFQSVNLEALKSDASSIDWTAVTTSNSIDDKVNAFNKAVTTLYDKHAPIRRVKVKHFPAPWLTQDIRSLMRKRDLAKRKFKKCPSDHNLACYKKLRNRCNRMCRDSKRSHIHNSIKNLNSAQIWKFLKSVGIGKSPHNSGVNIDLSALNKHFSLPPVCLEDHIKQDTLRQLLNKPIPKCELFYFEAVSECDVKRYFLSITSKAVGDDEISYKMINYILDELLSILTHIMNYSLTTSSFPSAWKKAYIIPLPKTPTPSSVSHYRPISILPLLSKILELTVHKQLSSFLSNKNLLNPFQSGFRSYHSTVTALLKVTDDIRFAMDNKQLTILVLLDFSSAFNSVDFDVLLSILQSLNVSPPVLAWFNSYLRGRSQSVRHDDSSSDWCDITAGVPQGGILSPLLFSVFINSISETITSNYHLYADDLQLYRHFSVADTVTAINQLNLDLESITSWAKSFGLLVNPDKSQAIIIGSRHLCNSFDQSRVPPVMLNGVSITLSKTVRNLGVILDNNLSWCSHVSDICRKVYFSFHSLKRLQNLLPFNTKITLVQTLLLPLFDYADVCFIDATEELLNKLERLQNLCLRFIFGLRKYDHVSQYRNELKWLPIRYRRDCHVLYLLYNIINNPSFPSYIRERFEFLFPSDHHCRPNTYLLLKIPRHTTRFYNNSFSVQAVRLWNALPADIRASPTIATFKRRLKEHYLSLF